MKEFAIHRIERKGLKHLHKNGNQSIPADDAMICGVLK
jgi:hypothetical protein